MKKIIILDRDGVICQDSFYYIKSPNELIMLPGSAEAIARLTRANYYVAVATNQSGIARGYYTTEQLQTIHQKMLNAVNREGGCIDWIEYCPHMPDFGCNCRKPKPGMLQNIAEHFHCSLTDVPFVGDRISDIEAAKAAGCIPIMILSTMTDQENLVFHPDVPVFSSLSDYVDQLLTAK